MSNRTPLTPYERSIIANTNKSTGFRHFKRYPPISMKLHSNDPIVNCSDEPLPEYELTELEQKDPLLMTAEERLEKSFEEINSWEIKMNLSLQRLQDTQTRCHMGLVSATGTIERILELK